HFSKWRLDGSGRFLEARQLGLDRLLIVILQLADAFRTAEHLAGLRQPRREFFGVERIFKPLLAERTLRFAAEALHALRYIGLEAYTALFAVVGDGDAGPVLLLHHIGDALLDLFSELGLIDLLAGLVGDQKIVKFGAARQAAGMRGQNVFGALE